MDAPTQQGLFGTYPHEAAAYEAQEASLTSDMHMADAKKVERIIGDEGRPFVPNGMGGRGEGRRLKHEGLFGEEGRYPRLGGEFSQADLDLLENSWIEKSHELTACFAPSGVSNVRATQGATNPYTKRSLNDMLAVLKGKSASKGTIPPETTTNAKTTTTSTTTTCTSSFTTTLSTFVVVVDVVRVY